MSGKTRVEFREYFVGTTLAEIHDAFRAEGLAPDLAHDPQLSGERRTLVEQYYHAVNWRDPIDVRKVLRVFEAVLIDLDHSAGDGTNADWAKKRAAQLRSWLTRDGIKEVDGRLAVPDSRQPDSRLSRIDTPELQRQTERLRRSVDEDPGLAVGTAKEIVETTCKTILHERGVVVVASWDVPRLVRETRKALDLLAEDIDDATKGAKAIKQLLSSLGTVTNSLAELRNLYGTGHGKHGKARGIHPRHAHLAVGAATTLATFLLDTHDARGP